MRDTDPLERVKKEIGRRSDIAGLYTNDRALIGLAGMRLIQQNDEWLVQRRDLSEHSIRQVLSEAEQTEQVMTTNKRVSGRFGGESSAAAPGS